MPFPFLLDDQEGSLMLSVMCDDRRGGQGDVQADTEGCGRQGRGTADAWPAGRSATLWTPQVPAHALPDSRGRQGDGLYPPPTGCFGGGHSGFLVEQSLIQEKFEQQKDKRR